MIRRIILENFMSHSRTVIEPAPGLTVLIGPNNCGKSAVVSALQILCSNIAGDFMVRHGEKDCRITVETGDDHTIVWRRHRGTVSYSIDDREVHRLGTGGTPDDLDSTLRLPKVVSEDGKDSFDIHFGAQKSPIFLLDESERRAAMFFASSSDAEHLMRMQKRHQEKVRDAKRDHSKLTEQLQKLDAELETLNPVAPLTEELQAVSQLYSAIQSSEQQAATLAQQVGELDRQREAFLRIAADCECLASLLVPPILAPVEPLRNLIEEIVAVESRLASEASRQSVLRELTPPPPLTDVVSLADLIQQLASITERHDLERQRSEAVSTLNAPPRLAETVSLDDLISRIRTATNDVVSQRDRIACLTSLLAVPEFDDTKPLELRIEELRLAADRVQLQSEREAAIAILREPPMSVATESLRECVATLEAQMEVVGDISVSHDTLYRLIQPPTLADLNPLRDLLTHVEAIQSDIDQHATALLETQAAMTALTDEVRVWTASHPVCPTCGGPLDAERLLTAEHAHG